jgi:hypothetical protein
MNKFPKSALISFCLTTPFVLVLLISPAAPGNQHMYHVFSFMYLWPSMRVYYLIFGNRELSYLSQISFIYIVQFIIVTALFYLFFRLTTPEKEPWQVEKLKDYQEKK